MSDRGVGVTSIPFLLIGDTLVVVKEKFLDGFMPQPVIQTSGRENQCQKFYVVELHYLFN
jgi:hypothetical protein